MIFDNVEMTMFSDCSSLAKSEIIHMYNVTQRELILIL